MNQALLVRSLSWLFRCTLLVVICRSQIAQAQAPANLSVIAGRTLKVTINSGNGFFAGTAGSRCHLLPSASGASYDIVPVPATSAISPSTGSIQNYSVNGSGNVATLSLYDTVFGVASTVTCTFSTPTSGSFSLNAGAAGSQSGTFTMSAANSPASIAGTMFVVTITSGGGAYGDTGQYRFRPNTANYNVESLSAGGIDSAGNYSYEKNHAYTGRIIYTNDTVVGNGATSRMSFDTATSGTITLIHQNGWPSGFQTGTFTFSPNTAPTISAFANATTNEDTQSGAIGFTVGDGQTLLPDLTVSATSSVPGLVSNFTFGGAGGNRTVMVMPAPNQSGTATITVAVTDAGGMFASRTFTLTVNTVNDPPTITPIANQTTAAGAATAAVPFTINDVDTLPTSLTMAKQSSNTTVVPLGNIVLGGSGTDRTVSVTPAAGQTGSSTITLTVNGGGTPASTSFTVTVNSPPTISNIPDTVTNEDTATAAIPITIGDTLTPLSSLSLSATSTNTGLVPVSGIVFGGSGGSRTVSVTPVANQSGPTTIAVTVTDGGGATASDSFLLTVNEVNDPPMISQIANQNTAPGTATPALPFTVSDVETPAASLIVSKASTNTALVPLPNIALGGSGTDRTVTVTPVAGQSGSSTITLTVSDGILTANTVFTLTVSTAPTISNIPDIFTNEDVPAGPIAFTVNDVGTPAGSLGVTASSSNLTLVPNANLGFGGSGGNRTLTVTPVANQFGLTTITVAVTDGGGLTASDSFVLMVNPINDTPVISFIANQTMTVSTATAAIPFTLSDLDTSASALTVTRTSSNTALIPVANIALGGSGASRTVTITPAAGQTGSSTITLTVSDSALSASSSFVLTVNPLTSAFSLSAWGQNGRGQFGNNTTTGSNAPTGISLTGAFAAKTVVKVSGGEDHSLALFSDGTVAAWGGNTDGQLGNGSTADSLVPVAVNTSGLLFGKFVTSIAAGRFHSLALCSDGTLVSWGDNGQRQLGNNGSVDSAVPVGVQSTGILSGKTVISIAAGGHHGLALCSDGTVAAWGHNFYGQLGNNSTTVSSVPVEVVKTGALLNKTVVAISAGGYHSLAVCYDGTLVAWGDNTYGQVGDNSTASRLTPVMLNTYGVLSGKTITGIASGYYHSFAVLGNGGAAAWGRNNTGQLGDSTSTDRSVPASVHSTGLLADKMIRSLSGGLYSSVGMCSDGSLAAWGQANQLGNNSSSNSLVPVAVDMSGAISGRSAIAVVSGTSHCLAVVVPAPRPLKITSLSRSAVGDVFLGFPTTEGLPYQIEWSNDLKSWTHWGAVNGTGGELTTQLTGQGLVPKRFFRTYAGPFIPRGFVMVPAGTFFMGSPVGELGRRTDETLHAVSISAPFYISKTEVTWAQWIAARNAASTNGYTDIVAGRNGYQGDAAGSHPVTEVTWWDAIKWCNLRSKLEGMTEVYYTSAAFGAANILKIGTPTVYANWSANGYRLPTEAEWEYACRAGTKTAFYSGGITYTGMTPLDPNLDLVGWYAANSGSNTHPVGLKAANAWGLQDTHGNVAEWCWDWYDNYAATVIDPRGPATGTSRVQRGVTAWWGYGADYARGAMRINPLPTSSSSYVGFRVVRGL